MSSSTRFIQKLLSCSLAELFTESERENLMGRVSVKKSTVPLETSFEFPPPGGVALLLFYEIASQNACVFVILTVFAVLHVRPI